MTMLRLNNLSFGYNPQRLIFEDVSFTVHPGEVFCIIGPNGCGKTTLIDSILGINQPQQGTIEVGGTHLAQLSPREFAQQIAYVPQNHTKTFPYTVLDIVVMGRTVATRGFGAPNASQRQRARESLKQVGLQGFEERLYTELSGGELQLVLIARALTQDARIIVLDEPTAHLDFRHELMVMEIITWLVQERGLTIIMATHFLNQAFYLENATVPTRVALMNQGKIAAIGPPSAVITKNNLNDVFKIVATTATTDDEGIQRKFIVPLKNIR